MSHMRINSIPSSNFNKSNEENSRYLFQFSEREKRVKITAHSFFVDFTSPKNGKTWGFSNLRERNSPKKESAHLVVVNV